MDAEFSVEAAHMIKSLCSPSHLLHIKRTESRAVVRNSKFRQSTKAFYADT